MSSSENKHWDFRKLLIGKIESLEKEANPNPNLVQILKTCIKVNNAAESVVTLEKYVNDEALKCRWKLNIFLQFQKQNPEIIIFKPMLNMDLESYRSVNKMLQSSESQISTLEQKIKEVLEIKNSEWDEVESLMEPGGLEKIENLAVEDQTEMEDQLKNTKMKLDDLINNLKSVKQQWDAVKKRVYLDLDDLLEQIHFAMETDPFMGLDEFSLQTLPDL